MSPDFPQLPDGVITAIVAGFYGAFGSVVHYLYEIVRDDAKQFNLPIFAINLVLGIFIGQVLGSFLSLDFEYRDGIILISGFLVYQILNLIELKGMSLLRKKLLDK